MSKLYTQNYDIDKSNEQAINIILSYFAEIESEKYPLTKGLIIRGCRGSGKTMTLKIIQKVLKNFSINNTRDVVSEFNQSGFGGISDFLNYKNRVFDDLGTEEKGLHFGNRIEVFTDLIERRYDLFQNKGIITHFTTNESNKEIQDRYGARAFDRLREMCCVVVLGDNNQSRRNKYNPIDKTEQKMSIELTPEQIKEKNNKSQISMINQIWNNNTVPDKFYEYAYNYLVKKGKLNLTESRKEVITIKAEEALKKYKAVESGRLFSEQKPFAARAIMQKEFSLISFQKKIAVIEYFEESKEMGIELTEIIN